MQRPSAPTETELIDLRRAATELAEKRRERLTSAHLLVAMFDLGCPAADLLRERRLTRDALLQAARSSTDDEPNPLQEAGARARRIASDMRSHAVGSLHLLAALLRVRQCAAFRALNQCGVDVHGLRNAAMNAALARTARQLSPVAAGRDERPGKRPASARTARTAARVEDSPIRGGKPRSGRAVSVPVMQLVKPVPRPAAPNASAALPVEGADHDSPVSASPRSDESERRPRRKSSFALDPRRFKLLCSVSTNLCLAAERGELPPVVGREREVEALLDVLAKKDANNPCLVGLPGVGKSSVVRALAKRIVSGEVRGHADERIVLEVSLGELIAGTQARGALAARLTELKRELRAAEGRVVLFIDDTQRLFGADSTEELIGEVERGLSDGGLKLLGAMTPADYQRLIESHSDLARRFSPVEVEEPELDQACRVLEVLAPGFEAHHCVRFEPAALAYAVAWSARYVPNRSLPEKALSILDMAGARAGRRGKTEVDAERIAEVVSELAGVPKDRLMETDAERFLRLEQALAERVVGHERELGKVAAILRRNAAGLGGQRPIGTFLLLGPTGVGKTETAKAIASVLFGSEHAMTRLDLSEYSEAHAVARLIGAPPGYVGFEAGGQLTEAVRRKPYQVLLLDEIEKAHQEVLETFLPLFDEGRLTDGRGHTVDFTNTVIILTSNIGAREAVGETTRRVGFGQSEVRGDRASRVLAAAREKLSPEFFNRIDEVLVFDALREPEVEEISRRLLQRLADTVFEQRDIELCIEPSVVRLLLEQGGFEASLGARPMKRAIARLIEAPLALALLERRFTSGDRVSLSVERDAVTFTREEDSAAAE